MATDFGRDTYCLDALRTGRYASGVLLVAQRCYHRLSTERGLLPGDEDEQDFGIDLLAELGRVADGGHVELLRAKIRGELGKEEAVDEVEAFITPSTDGPVVSYEIDIRAKTGEGPFQLVLAASAVSLALLKITAEAA